LDETLEVGDLLYVPRGALHIATGVREPSLHLTFALYKRTGVDLLEWLVRQLQAKEIVRMDVPRFESPEQRASYVARLKEEVLATMDDSVLDRFLSDWDTAAVPRRPRFSLPWSATRTVLPSDGAVLRLVAPRPLAPARQADGGIEFTVARQTWRLSAAEHRALQPLLERGECSLSELYARADSGIAPTEMRESLVDLILGGLVAIVGDSSSNEAEHHS
jgi:hypothetical protein